MAQNFSRYFTLEEARAALPEIVSKLEAVQRIRGELSELAAEMEGMGGGDRGEKTGPAEAARRAVRGDPAD